MSTQEEDNFNVDDEEEVEGTEEESTEEEEETVDTLKERLGKADAALKKANREATRLRNKYEPSKNTNNNGGKNTQKAEEGPDWKSVAVRTAARDALRSAGLTGSVEKAVKLLDLRDVEIDEDGVLDDDLADQIEELKEDFPNLFKSAAEESVPVRTVRPPRLNGTAAREAVKTKTASEIQAEQMFGRKRR